MTTLLWAVSPSFAPQDMYYTATIGASGAIYGVLLAYAIYFPHRTIYLYFVFPIQAKYFVMIVGAITFLSSIGGASSGIAHSRIWAGSWSAICI